MYFLLMLVFLNLIQVNVSPFELMICTSSSYVTYGHFTVHKSTRQHLGGGRGKKGVHWDMTTMKRDVNLNKNREG